jgi:hypothetical protein
MTHVLGSSSNFSQRKFDQNEMQKNMVRVKAGCELCGRPIGGSWVHVPVIPGFMYRSMARTQRRERDSRCPLSYEPRQSVKWSVTIVAAAYDEPIRGVRPASLTGFPLPLACGVNAWHRLCSEGRVASRRAMRWRQTMGTLDREEDGHDEGGGTL